MFGIIVIVVFVTDVVRIVTVILCVCVRMGVKSRGYVLRVGC